MEYISYNGADVGLTNQKIAMVGLSHRAMREKKGIKLPPLVVFDPLGTELGRRVPFHIIYNMKNIVRILEAFSIPVLDASSDQYDVVDALECFQEGAERFGEVRSRGDAALYDLTCQLVRSFDLNADILDIIDPVSKFIFQEKKIEYCIQMRIEKDWELHTRSVLHNLPLEDNFPSALGILSKIKGKFGKYFSSAFVMSDEKNMFFQKEDIKRTVEKETGVSLFWKSDIIDVSRYDSLTLSLVDFCLASRSPYFIGTSHSTFSCFVTFEKYCRLRKPVRNHFIYNGESGGIDERFDNGTATRSSLVVEKTFARDVLLEKFSRDISLPMEVWAHISNIGEYVAKNSVCSFPSCSDLVVGTRDMPDRHRIEGFSIVLDHKILRLRYKAILENGMETEWVSNKEYCGTRGEHLSLSGFAIEILGPEKLEIECVYGAIFSGDQRIAVARDGEFCRACNENGRLLTFQISFRKRIQKDFQVS